MIRVVVLILLSAALPLRGERQVLFSPSSHQDMEELLLNELSVEEELAEMVRALEPVPARIDAFQAFLENKAARKAVLAAEASELYGTATESEASLAFHAYDPESAFGKKLAVFHRTNDVLLRDLLTAREYLAYRQHLRERKRSQRLQNAVNMLEELDIQLPEERKDEVLNLLAGIPSFLPRTNPESLATGFSRAYLSEREFQRLSGEKEYLQERFAQMLGAEPARKVAAWYDGRMEQVREHEAGVEMEGRTGMLILVPQASRPVRLESEGRKRLFIDILEEGIALVPMERINVLSRSVLRSYGVSSRGDASRLVTFLHGRDLLVDNYRVELDYLLNGIIYLSRDNPWSGEDLVTSVELRKLAGRLGTSDQLEFLALVRDGAEEQFRAVEQFLHQLGFPVTSRKLGIDEALPCFLPGLDQTYLPAAM